MTRTTLRSAFGLFCLAALAACGSVDLIELNNNFTELSRQTAEAERSLDTGAIDRVEYENLVEVNRVSFEENGDRAVAAAGEADSPRQQVSFLNLAVRSYLSSGPAADTKIPDLAEQGIELCADEALQGLNALPVTCGYFHIGSAQAVSGGIAAARCSASNASDRSRPESSASSVASTVARSPRRSARPSHGSASRIRPWLLSTSVSERPIAANAVMAGCRAEHMEVLVPVLRAACDERFNLHGVQATTISATPLVILSGPAAELLGFASGAGVFGNVARANSTVGRALQLVMANLGGARPGEIDMATLGHPGRFSYCISENHAASPWEPLHVELGFGAEESTVTLFAATGLMEVSEHTARTAEGVLRTIAATLSVVWSWRRCGRVDAVVVVCPEHAATIAGHGLSKRDARDFLFEHTGVPVRAFEHEGTEGTQQRDSLTEVLLDGEPHYRKFDDPSQIRLVVAGGTAGKFSAVLGGWLAGPKGSESVTYPISKELR